jgi:biotin operon repressor
LAATAGVFLPSAHSRSKEAANNFTGTQPGEDVKTYAKIPRSLLKSGVSDAAVRLYGLLSLNFASVDELSRELGKTTTTVRKHLKELMDAGAVEVTTTTMTRQVVRLKEE